MLVDFPLQVFIMKVIIHTEEYWYVDGLENSKVVVKLMLSSLRATEHF